MRGLGLGLDVRTTSKSGQNPWVIKETGCLFDSIHFLFSRPYDVPQSWGKTYGEHKLYLEFSVEAYNELKRYAEEEVGVIFSASGFDYGAIDFLTSINIPFFKVPSPDVGNLDFIEYMAKKHIPMVISSG